jgi:hypothetical protein
MPTQSGWFLFLFLSFTFAVFAYGLKLWVMAELADDGAFFLRYAENMMNGEFWVWNKGEEPLWGASAPLWPLILALASTVGFKAEAAVHASGIIVASAGLTITVYVLTKKSGLLASVLFILLILMGTNTLFSEIIFNNLFSNSANGLETPLTILLLSLGLYAITISKSQIFLGVIVGLLSIHKIDIAPAAFFALVAFSLAYKKIPYTAIAISFCIFIGWYLFAWFHFGSVLPNALITKMLHQSDLRSSTPPGWFFNAIITNGHRGYLWLAAITSFVFLNKKEWPIVIFLFGISATHLLVYSVKYPFEPYDWYLSAAIYASTVFFSFSV